MSVGSVGVVVLGLVALFAVVCCLALFLGLWLRPFLVVFSVFPSPGFAGFLLS